MKNSIVRFGLVGAVLAIIFFVGPWLIWGTSLPYDTAETIGYLSILISLSVVFFGVKHFRDHRNDGRLTFSEGFKTGVLIALFPSVAVFFYTVLFFNYYGDAYLEYANTHMQKTMSADEFAQYQAQVEAMSGMMKSPVFQGGVMFLTVFIIGLVVSVLSAMVLKKSNLSVKV